MEKTQGENAMHPISYTKRHQVQASGGYTIYPSPHSSFQEAEILVVRDSVEDKFKRLGENNAPDKTLSPQAKLLNQLGTWKDENRNGIIDSGEVKSLADRVGQEVDVNGTQTDKGVVTDIVVDKNKFGPEWFIHETIHREL